MQEDETGGIFADGNVIHLLWKPRGFLAASADDDRALLAGAGQFKRYPAKMNDSAFHGSQIHLQIRLNRTEIEAGRDVHGHNGRLRETRRIFAPKANADLRDHRLNYTGEVAAEGNIASSEHAGAPQKIGQEVLTKARFVRGEPSPGRIEARLLRTS